MTRPLSSFEEALVEFAARLHCGEPQPPLSSRSEPPSTVELKLGRWLLHGRGSALHWRNAVDGRSFAVLDGEALKVMERLLAPAATRLEEVTKEGEEPCAVASPADPSAVLLGRSGLLLRYEPTPDGGWQTDSEQWLWNELGQPEPVQLRAQLPEGLVAAAQQASKAARCVNRNEALPVFASPDGPSLSLGLEGPGGATIIDIWSHRSPNSAIGTVRGPGQFGVLPPAQASKLWHLAAAARVDPGGGLRVLTGER